MNIFDRFVLEEHKEANLQGGMAFDEADINDTLVAIKTKRKVNILRVSGNRFLAAQEFGEFQAGAA